MRSASFPSEHATSCWSARAARYVRVGSTVSGAYHCPRLVAQLQRCRSQHSTATPCFSISSLGEPTRGHAHSFQRLDGEKERKAGEWVLHLMLSVARIRCLSAPASPPLLWSVEMLARAPCLLPWPFTFYSAVPIFDLISQAGVSVRHDLTLVGGRTKSVAEG